MKNEDVLVIIPARGGSKRIVKKNIKHICGQPMIYWPLGELRKKFLPSHIIVSTDDNEIIEVVKQKGLKVPFKRPKNLSDDYVGTAEVAKHALDWFENNVKVIDYVLIVYPTAVLLDICDIKSAYSSLGNDKNCNCIFSATSFSFPIQRAIYEKENGYIDKFNPSDYPKRSQDLIKAYHDAGQFYIYRATALRNKLDLKEEKTKIFKLNRKKVIDIDDYEDFDIAEEKMKSLGYLERQSDWKF